jgi:mRNA interferase RelE/StbE
LKRFSRLDHPTQNRIIGAIDELAEKNRGDIRRLEGGQGSVFRLRVGGWRVLFSYLDDGGILLQRIRPRGDAYKR